jgi:hypothetical protein
MAARSLAAFLVVALGSTACASTSGAHAPGSLASARGDPAVAAALDWLQVLKASDAEKLLEISQLPLTVREGDVFLPKRRCDTMIGDLTRMERLIGCLREHIPDFFTKFGADQRTTLEATDRTQLATSLGNALGPARPGERVVRAHIRDGGWELEATLLLVPGEKDPLPRVATAAFKVTFTVD